MKRTTIFGLAVAAFVTANVPATASILAVNYGVSYPSDSNQSDSVPNGYIAALIVAQNSGTLTQLALGVGESTPLSITAGLYTNNVGQPGTLLDSWTFTAPASDKTLTTLDSVLNPTITQSSEYFLVLSGPGIAIVDWAQSDVSGGGYWSGATLTGLNHVSFQTNALGFSLNGTPAVAPEPGTLTLLALAALATLGAGRRLNPTTWRSIATNKSTS